MEPAAASGALTPAGVAGRLASRRSVVDHLYLHLPFCERICPYCDFSTAVGAGSDPEAFLDDLAGEWELLAAAGLGERLDLTGGTLYLGGGTPSWFEPVILERLLDWVAGLGGRDWTEATVEVNPEHTDAGRLRTLRARGVTRLSLGVQSLDEVLLRRLGRVHRAEQVYEGFARARSLGFDLALDLIFAVPGQDLAGWQRDLEAALSLEPDHLSLYGLTWEEGTVFTRRLHEGRLVAWSGEAEAEAYQWAVERLRAGGWERYEVSNFARPGQRAIHNSAYWNGEDYLGLGPSAHSLLAGVRTAGAFRLTDWSRRVRAGEIPWTSVEVLGPLERARERVLLGLRTADGVGLEEIPEAYRERVATAAAEIVSEGLAAWSPEEGRPERLALTDRGFLLADEVAVRVAP